jgi:hypothetical protein
MDEEFPFPFFLPLIKKTSINTKKMYNIKLMMRFFNNNLKYNEKYYYFVKNND